MQPLQIQLQLKLSSTVIVTTGGTDTAVKDKMFTDTTLID
jgi:hypothetical protein